MMYNNSLSNMFLHTQGMMKASEQLSSGKRVNRPSDDPTGIGDILMYKTRLARNERYVDMSQKAENYLIVSEGKVATATDLANRAKELAMSQLGAATNADTGRITALEIAQLAETALGLGNSKVGGDYIFGGRRTNFPPIDANGEYAGDSKNLVAEVNEDYRIDMSILASEFLTTDMNPKLDVATPLSILRGGMGISTGNFTITDRSGVSGNVQINPGMNISNLIAAINSSGANVTASLAPDGMSLRIMDNTPTASVSGPMTISDNAGGASARELGLAGSRNLQYVFSTDLNPTITAATRLSDLFGGKGMILADIELHNGSASATVSFASAVTIGDVLNTINTAPINATASINASGTSLSLVSATSATVAFAKDIGGNTAELLGIGGGRNLISTLKNLEQAMLANDKAGIMNLIDNLSSAVLNTSMVRGVVGARTNRLQHNADTLQSNDADTKTMLSYSQDADMAAAATEFALMQTAYQATIKSSASIIQPTLLDFIR